MEQVFFEDRALIFADHRDNPMPGAINLPFTDLNRLVSYALGPFRELPHYSQVRIDCGSMQSEKVFEGFLSSLPVVEAGGGLVRTPAPEGNGYEYLYIYRNRMWDLPKGKREKGESREENALREVQEETGLKDVRLLDFIASTYHFVSLRNGKTSVKQSNWFEMEVGKRQEPIPQKEEGITEALWLNARAIKERLPLMYASIAYLTEHYFGKHA